MTCATCHRYILPADVDGKGNCIDCCAKNLDGSCETPKVIRTKPWSTITKKGRSA